MGPVLVIAAPVVGIIATKVVTSVCSKKVYYYCPACGNEVWAFSGFEGNTCWPCKFNNPVSNKGGWYYLMNTKASKTSNIKQFY